MSLQKLYAKFLSQEFLHNIDTESFTFFCDSGMGCCCYCSSRQEEADTINFPRFQGNISLRAIKIILPKTVFDFTVGRLSENVKILSRWINDICLQQGAQRGDLQKRNSIPHLSVSCTIKGSGHLTQLA